MPTEKQLLSLHAQQYIRKLFAERLRQEGFVSYRGQDFAWYRVINNEVIQTLYFYATFICLPAIMEVGCGNHPLYIEPLYPSGVYYHNIPCNDEIFRQIQISKLSNTYYSPDILVSCPNDEYKGFDIIESILDEMNRVDSALEAYQKHKSRYQKWGYRAASIDFFDEVIYNNDTELYAPCLESLELKIRSWNQYPKRTEKIANILAHLELQKQAMLTGKRDEVLAALQAKQRRIIKALNRNVGIHVIEN